LSLASRTPRVSHLSVAPPRLMAVIGLSPTLIERLKSPRQSLAPNGDTSPQRRRMQAAFAGKSPESLGERAGRGQPPPIGPPIFPSFCPFFFVGTKSAWATEGSVRGARRSNSCVSGEVGPCRRRRAKRSRFFPGPDRSGCFQAKKHVFKQRFRRVGIRGLS